MAPLLQGHRLDPDAGHIPDRQIILDRHCPGRYLFAGVQAGESITNPGGKPMVRTPLRCVILLAAALLLIPAAPAGAQKIDDLAHANKIEYNACKYKAAQMRDEARHYDRARADLPGMEKQAADLQAKLDVLNPKYQSYTGLMEEQKTLNSELPKVEKECQEAWISSLSSACTRRNQITKRLYEEINPELARLRAEMPSLGEERKKVEDTLSVIKMNLQSHQNYLARTTRPTDQQIAEQDGKCQLMELSMGLDSKASKSTVTIAATASEGMVGDEVHFGALLSPKDPRTQFGYVWSLNGQVIGGNTASVKTNIPSEGANTVRVVAWRWTGRQWVKTAEASRDITGKPRVQQTVSITGPASVLIQDQPKTIVFEARIMPEVPNEQYGFTWGASGGPRGPMTFNSYTKTQSLSASTPGRYDILVHAWKLVNGKWLLIAKASLPITIEKAASAPPTGRQLSTPRGLAPAGR